MNVRKYQLYLLMVALVVTIVGVLSYIYFTEQEKSYQDGTLVQNVYLVEEELA